MKARRIWIQCSLFILSLALIHGLWLCGKSSLDGKIESIIKEEQALKNNSCELPNGDMHVCWLGAHMLSKDGEFYRSLQRKASADDTIILASVDSAFVDLAINYYKTSFKRFKISNFLFICSDSLAVKTLAANGIDCFLYPQGTDNENPTGYGYKEFFKKQRVKVKMVTAALMLGYTAVLSDLDMVFLADPTPRFRIKEDVSFMLSVGIEVNGGFYIARPTPAAIELHRRVLQLLMTNIGSHQKAINNVLGNMVASKAIYYQELLQHEFVTGLAYFEHGNRTFRFDKPCLNGSCGIIAVHNNFLRTKAAKIYRFKENGMWYVDNKGYYSDPSRKYLQFSNPLVFGNETRKREESALRTALTIAELLNRTLILPIFHCCDKNTRILHCAFSHHFHVVSFEHYFANQYRENVFLQHPLVPDNIKRSASKEIYIATRETRDKITTAKDVIAFNATDYNNGCVSATDVTRWFGEGPFADFSVLRFHSLYATVKHNDKTWQKMLDKAIVVSHYTQ